MSSPASSDDLLKLCESGRFYQVQAWIDAGKPLTVPDAARKTPLGVALKAGFHSLVELLLRYEESQLAKNEALASAVQMRRRDLVELAFAYGGHPASVSFFDVLLSWDKSIAALFIERGADLVTGMPFGCASEERIRTALGIYLECKRTTTRAVCAAAGAS